MGEVVQGLEDRDDGRRVLEVERGIGHGAAEVEVEEAAGDCRRRDFRPSAPYEVVDPARHPGHGALERVGDGHDSPRASGHARHQAGHLGIAQVRTGQHVAPAGLGPLQGADVCLGDHPHIDDLSPPIRQERHRRPRHVEQDPRRGRPDVAGADHHGGAEHNGAESRLVVLQDEPFGLALGLAIGRAERDEVPGRRLDGGCLR